MPEQEPFVRAYRKADAEAIARLYRETVRAINARDYSPAQIAAWARPEQDAAWWRERLARYPAVFVAERRGEVAGFAETEDSGHVDCLYVHHRHQGAGIGSALLAAVEARAKGRGIRRLFADVSLTAHPFFRAKGFTVLRKTASPHLGEIFELYEMEKHLEP